MIGSAHLSKDIIKNSFSLNNWSKGLKSLWLLGSIVVMFLPSTHPIAAKAAAPGQGDVADIGGRRRGDRLVYHLGEVD